MMIEKLKVWVISKYFITRAYIGLFYLIVFADFNNSKYPRTSKLILKLYPGNSLSLLMFMYYFTLNGKGKTLLEDLLT